MANITISLDEDSPYYLQIYYAICNQINQGYLRGGEKIPSKRQLANNLNVSVNTVLTAYQILLSEGYIESKEKSGYYVIQQNPITLPAKIIEHDLIKEEIKCFDLTTENVTINNFSFASFIKTSKKVLYQQDFLHKTSSYGAPLLRQVIARHLLENRGIHVSYSQIIIGNGLEMVAHFLTSLNISGCALENPGYHKLAHLLKCPIEYCMLDEQGVQLPQKSQVLYTTSFNQFPTGIKMSILRKKEIISWLKEDAQRIVIEDDFDAEFRISGNPTTSIFAMAPEQTIFFSTFSTSLFPGLRIAYMILPDALMKTLDKVYIAHSCPVSTLDQYILLEYIQNGSYARHVNRLKNIYRNRQTFITNYFKNKLSFPLEIKKNYLSIILSLPNNINASILQQELKKDNIIVHTLKDYDVEMTTSNQIIIGYTNIDIEDLPSTLDFIISKIEQSQV